MLIKNARYYDGDFNISFADIRIEGDTIQKSAKILPVTKIFSTRPAVPLFRDLSTYIFTDVTGPTPATRRYRRLPICPVFWPRAALPHLLPPP